MKNYPTDEMLSAYVDGELSPQDDARVADAVANSPSLAARVAALSRMKSALSGLVIEPPEKIYLPRQRRSAFWVAFAASAALFIVVMSGALTGYLNFGGNSGGWYDAATARHISWLDQTVSPDAGEIDANVFLASISRLHLPVYAPDLSDAKLRLTYLQFVESDGSSPAALHLGYTGRRGCKVTLWVTSAPSDMSTKLSESRDGNLRGFHWRAGRTAYALFAAGMEEHRFTTIADKVYEATRNGHGFDDEMRTALNEATRTAPPCSA